MKSLILKNKQYVTLHFTPASSEKIYSHHVKKMGKTWNVSFQHRWPDQEVLVGIAPFSWNRQSEGVI